MEGDHGRGKNGKQEETNVEKKNKRGFFEFKGRTSYEFVG